MYPKQGWSPTGATKFQKCLNKAACERSDPDVELCAAHYKGPLCGQCQAGYGDSFDFQCKACPEDCLQAPILIIHAFLLPFCIAAILTYTTIKGVEGDYDPESKRSTEQETHDVQELVKMAIGMAQSLMFLKGFAYTWPDAIQNLLHVSETAGGGGVSWLSSDCMYRLLASDVESLYVSMLVVVLLGIVTWLLISAF